MISEEESARFELYQKRSEFLDRQLTKQRFKLKKITHQMKQTRNEILELKKQRKDDGGAFAGQMSHRRTQKNVSSL